MSFLRPRAGQAEGEGCSFETEQELLGFGPAPSAIAAEPVSGRRSPDDAMAGNDDRDRIAAACNADGARDAADKAGDFAIALRRAVGNPLHRRPDLLLERAPGGRKR